MAVLGIEESTRRERRCGTSVALRRRLREANGVVIVGHDCIRIAVCKERGDGGGVLVRDHGLPVAENGRRGGGGVGVGGSGYSTTVMRAAGLRAGVGGGKGAGRRTGKSIGNSLAGGDGGRGAEQLVGEGRTATATAT